MGTGNSVVGVTDYVTCCHTLEGVVQRQVFSPPTRASSGQFDWSLRIVPHSGEEKFSYYSEN